MSNKQEHEASTLADSTVDFLPHTPVIPTLPGPETFTFTPYMTVNVKMHLHKLGIHKQCHF